ncbi:hypothetical protein V5799_026102 [Amblyomma americanum]|uniref:Uncharacterized protein n=1 Tax=Amblyomma americanum TaxID=6943 RepID=A0AAQ4DJJ2_AMBAM
MDTSDETSPEPRLKPEDLEEKYRTLEQHLRRLHRLAEGNSSYAALLDTVNAQLGSVNTSSGAYGVMLTVKAATKPDRRRGQKIKVQPTSLARRRPGLARGSGRVPAGRPPQSGAVRSLKRKHALSCNVRDNVPSAKCH